MGKLNCSCFNNNEKGQISFENNNNDNANNNIIIQNISLFEIISKYYNSKNIEIQKINNEEFFEMINSEPNITKLLNEYDEIFDKYNINFDFNNTDVELIKLIDNNDKTESSISFYYGEFNQNGIINGTGIKIVKNNYIYKGEFSNGDYNGKGLLIKKGASIFGDWEYGEINGNVIYKIESKFEYIGNFENNKKNGLGTEKYPDGSLYEGNFVDNKKSGHGTFSFANNEYYEGNFEDDLYNGEGQYVWGKEGKQYVGEFKKGKIEGKGTYRYEDGTIFNGSFIDGCKNGEGCIEFPDGKKYCGNWLNDELYGNGYLLNGNTKIEIVFRHGKIISQKISEEVEEGNNDLNITNKETLNHNNNNLALKFLG